MSLAALAVTPTPGVVLLPACPVLEEMALLAPGELAAAAEGEALEGWRECWPEREDEGMSEAPDGYAYFMDHAGSLIGPWPLEPYPVGRDPSGPYNHRLMRPQAGQLIQAISWCGGRAHKPATGPVDCPQCLAGMAEESDAPSP